VASVAVLALYISAPYVRGLQIALRRSLKNYFDLIFGLTMLGAGLLMVIGGTLWEARRSGFGQRGPEARSGRLLRIASRKAGLSVICLGLYYAGLWYTVGSNPVKGIRIIEFIHLFEYTGLTLIVLWAVSGSVDNRCGYLLALLAMYLVGLGDEGVQAFLARRVGEYRDVVTNIIVCGLAIVSVRLLFPLSRFTKPCSRATLAAVMYVAAASSFLTGCFIASVHIGYRIEDDRCGVFYSLYTKSELLKLSGGSEYGPLTLAGQGRTHHKDGGYWAKEDFYETEARKHRAERDIFLASGRFWEAFCEERIRQIYYGAYADWQRWIGWTEDSMRKRFGEFDVASFVSYHHDLVYRGWRAWEVWSAAAVVSGLFFFLGVLASRRSAVR